jgi:23S rRNA U2552 (ribose-2'-O)-methylase RlmE/FtsJ
MGRTPYVVALCLAPAAWFQCLVQESTPSSRSRIAEVHLADSTVARLTLCRDIQYAEFSATGSVTAKNGGAS